MERLESEAQETADLLGVPVICGDFLHIQQEQQVDIITMGDVIEHLQRPMDGLRKAWELLKEGGVLWLSTPNFESSFTRMMKAFDAMWCEPYHITYFFWEGLLRLLDQVGFELLEYTVSNRYNGSMELLLRKRSCNTAQKRAFFRNEERSFPFAYFSVFRCCISTAAIFSQEA